MKTWFFLSFLALLLIQGSAGATTLSTSLTTLNPPCPTGKNCSGTGIFTLTNADNPDPTQRSFSYRITLSPDEILKYYFSPPSYNTQLPTNTQISPSVPITLPSVVDIFIGDIDETPTLEIAQLSLSRDSFGNPFVSEFITRDPNIFINLNDNSLSGTMSYSECSSTTGDGSCNLLSNPVPLLTCQDYLYVYDNDLGPTGLDLKGQICTAAAAPAPSSLSLVGIGLAGLGLLRQRRKPLVGRVSAA